ncbi:hypothetical protein B0A49_03039 [Cryomyces minteri]|uniref:Isotrichodermin C-15 hydroxylase n=1 Tax=Cryomyces minteri TaxID=331657 RepID=A0A4V5NHH6_9PEZI|nr:hypothetical protein B0A49_03039 [Cryomyces minteri]
MGLKTSDRASGLLHLDADNMLTLSGSTLLLFLLYHVGRAIYNVYFHPLSKYPDPKALAATRLPLLRALAQGKSVSWTQALHNQYGPVVRISPDELSYIDARGWKDIYGHRIAGKTANNKDRMFYGKAVNDVDSILLADEAAHSRSRRIFAHAFSDKALKEQEPLFKNYVNLLAVKLNQILGKDPQAKVDVVKYYNFTTFDIMGDLTFGEPLNLLEGSEYNAWVSMIFAGVKASSMMRILRYFPLLDMFWKLMLPKSLEEKRIQHFQYSTDRVDRRLATSTDRPDIWTLVMNDQEKEGKGLSVKEMHSNASLFMIAGTETTATLLSGLTYYLLKNPQCMKKLVDELRGAFATDDEITIEALAQLKYLHACLEEALRLYPPVPIGLPRKTPAEGTTICGDWVAGGTTVSVHHYSTYRSEANFREPNSFIPERWLSDPRFVSDNKAALQPFSFGPRNCLGKNLAYHEMRLILSKVLCNFDLSLCEECENWAEQDVYVLWEKHPLLVNLTPVARG